MATRTEKTSTDGAATAEAPERMAAETSPAKSPARRRVAVTVNGTEHVREVEARTLLVHFIRDELRLTGTHIGCDTTSCGACTVLLNGTPVKSCTMFAVQADGAEIRTVEGLETAGGLHPLQEGFRQEHGLQCGFCTPGMLLVGVALLEENPDPSDAEIRRAISGNLCRCTGYQNIVRSVRHAADTMAGRDEHEDEATEGGGT